MVHEGKSEVKEGRKGRTGEGEDLPHGRRDTATKEPGGGLVSLYIDTVNTKRLV